MACEQCRYFLGREDSRPSTTGQSVQAIATWRRCRSQCWSRRILRPLDHLSERLMTHPVLRRNRTQSVTTRDARRDGRKMLNEPVVPPLGQRDRFVHREVPLLGHAASFPIGVASATFQCDSRLPHLRRLAARPRS